MRTGLALATAVLAVLASCGGEIRLTSADKAPADAGPSGCSGDADCKDARCDAVASCEGERPICDVAGGRCVECLTDAQCTGEKRRCDPLSGRCVDCLASADCADEEHSKVCDLERLECEDQ